MKKSAIALMLTVVTSSFSLAASQPAELRAMTVATSASHKVSAPVEMYFQHLRPADVSAPNLKLAVVPQIAVNSLRLELSPGEGVSFDKAAAGFKMQKAAAAGIYNRFLNIGRSGNKPAMIRATVWVETDSGTFFSVFNIPADAASAAAMKGFSTRKPGRKQHQH